MRVIDDVEGLESAVGSRPLPSMLKTIPDLDEHCERILALSPAGVLGWQDSGGRLRATVVGGEAGFAVARTPTVLALPRPAGATPAVGSAVSTVFLVPGLGETLRVNGVLTEGSDGLEVAVGEAFAHCAKCVLRSKLWEDAGAPRSELTAWSAPAPPSDGPLAADGVAELLARAPFAVLSTRDAGEGADVSPKGDPPGFVQVLDGHRVALPDRPGNRRTDTFHNLVADAAVGLVALVPGEDRVVELTGRASLTDDADLLATMAVNGRSSKVAVVIDVEEAWVQAAPELARAGMWDTDRRVPADQLPDMSQVFVDHVKRNRDKGETADAIRAGIDANMLREGLAHDYRENLF